MGTVVREPSIDGNVSFFGLLELGTQILESVDRSGCENQAGAERGK
jgi:hypothetical protein